jgi:hypothetical protein
MNSFDPNTPPNTPQKVPKTSPSLVELMDTPHHESTQSTQSKKRKQPDTPTTPTTPISLESECPVVRPARHRSFMTEQEYWTQIDVMKKAFRRQVCTHHPEYMNSLTQHVEDTIIHSINRNALASTMGKPLQFQIKITGLGHSNSVTDMTLTAILLESLQPKFNVERVFNNNNIEFIIQLEGQTS